MSEVISFKEYREHRHVVHIENEPTISYNSFLSTMKDNLSPEDYMEFMEASLDPAHYDEAEEEIQDLVDGFFAKEKIQIN